VSRTSGRSDAVLSTYRSASTIYHIPKGGRIVGGKLVERLEIAVNAVVLVDQATLFACKTIPVCVARRRPCGECSGPMPVPMLSTVVEKSASTASRAMTAGLFRSVDGRTVSFRPNVHRVSPVTTNVHWTQCSFLGNHEKITINRSPAFAGLEIFAIFTHFEP
jgi:hypothetical protein